MRQSGLGGMLLLVLSGAVSPTTGQERPPVIDMHMHARGEVGGELHRDIIEAMDHYNVVLGFLSDRSPAVLFEWLDAAPGRFVASPAVRDPADADLPALRREYDAGRLGGMGEVESQYVGVAADDPSLEPVFALAAEYGVPVLVHSHGTGAPISPNSPNFRIDVGRPTRLEEVVVRHPELLVSIESSGYPFLEGTIALMHRYPNVYGDLSSWKSTRAIFEWYLQRLVDAGFGDRLMFGSDVTTRPQVIAESIEAIESISFLTEEQKRDILCNNAARFLRLDPSPCGSASQDQL